MAIMIALFFKLLHLLLREDTGFTCPDNIAFDQADNLWLTSDISGGEMNKPPYESFKNNGLFIMPRIGPQA